MGPRRPHPPSIPMVLARQILHLLVFLLHLYATCAPPVEVYLAAQQCLMSVSIEGVTWLGRDMEGDNTETRGQDLLVGLHRHL